MKNLFIITALILSGIVYSQIIVGDAIGTAPINNKSSVLLEFANTNNKGILLPYVRQKTSIPTEGSIILDVTDPTNARIKFFNNTPSTTDHWTDLSGQGADVSFYLNSQPTMSQITEDSNARSIIGANFTTVNDGVLVLESSTKALVLPVVSDVNNIPSPSPGMMVFVNKTGTKRLAVFNGSKWSFWKP
ncbi:hypothetical protein SAMN05444360_1345 [Chryseobacterium carnipullorum]|uniref:hypothetical protein n=1 Tax=Chryseobacterium TaxID=59732 RepID=UPI000922DCAB|nr:hypothetical protein [Chryseobacterium carnipullorum]SHN06536.1 hypothetical protein SAMN05444360_1345 [Chryseobacterium carnipullorum]